MPESSTGQPLQEMPEAFVSSSKISREVSRAVKAGRLRKLASRLYTRNLSDAPEAIVRRNLWTIAAGYFPGALIADRTALENAPAEDGSVCLITRTGSDIKLPGVVLRPRRGKGPLSSDRPFVAGLFVSSTARAYLENMRASRARSGHVPRTLRRQEIENRLDTMVRRGGEESINRLRDEMRDIAPELDLNEEGTELDALIGALLGTREAELHSPLATARRRGRPYDPERLGMFHALHAALRSHPPLARLADEYGSEGNATLAFFEAYFSNFIEGTEFAVEEAADIVFRGVIPSERPEDAHDVLGTWRIVSDAEEMRRTPQDVAALVRLLKARHTETMEARPHQRPGEFKQIHNRAGSTVFVAHDLVEGTLEQSFGLYRSLETPFQRAAFMMFLISEVHPFADGNGRTARIMMNAELVAAGEQRIVIPTIYRANYLSALKALSHGRRTQPLIAMLDYAQRWTAAVAWGALDDTRRELESCNAFLEPEAADQGGKRLWIPGRPQG